MLNNKFTLILTDSEGKRCGIVNTPRSPRTGTGNNAASPAFLEFCRSAFALHRAATDILVVSLESWRSGAGIDLATLPMTLRVRRAALDNGRPALSYSTPERADKWTIIAR